jgi:inosose dehydratase
MLDELAGTGYEGTELGDWGYMPTDPEILSRELGRRDIALLGAFVPVALKNPDAHTPGEERALQVARLLSAVHQRQQTEAPPFLVLADENGSDPERTRKAGRISAPQSLSEGQWTTFAEGATRIATSVRREAGLRTVFHHHCAGYVETPDEIGTFLDRTDPSLVGLVLDTGHLAFGSGGDASLVIQAMDRFADRIWYIHLKDCDGAIAEQARAGEWDYFTAVRHGVFCELGKGGVDFPRVLQWLRRRNYGGWVLVEQDVLPGMGSPRESAQRNRDYLRSLGI